MNATVFRETVRRHMTSVPFLFALLLFCATAGSVATLGGPMVVLQIVSLVGILLSCQLIGPEFSRGTLQLILVKPLNRSAYLLSRVAGVVVVLWVAIWISFAVDVIARLIAGATIDWTSHAVEPVNVSLATILLAALFALFGSMTRSYLNVAIYFCLKIGLPLFNGILSLIQGGTMVRRYPAIVKTVSTIDTNLFPDASGVGRFDRQWTLMVLSNAAVALFLACLVFRNREVPYGAD